MGSPGSPLSPRERCPGVPGLRSSLKRWATLSCDKMTFGSPLLNENLLKSCQCLFSDQNTNLISYRVKNCYCQLKYSSWNLATWTIHPESSCRDMTWSPGCNSGQIWEPVSDSRIWVTLYGLYSDLTRKELSWSLISEFLMNKVCHLEYCSVSLIRASEFNLWKWDQNAQLKGWDLWWNSVVWPTFDLGWWLFGRKSEGLCGWKFIHQRHGKQVTIWTKTSFQRCDWREGSTSDQLSDLK